MTDHLHGTHVDGCYRCELSRAESEEYQAGINQRRGDFDHEGLMQALQAIGGNMDSYDDAAFAADELLDSRWFRAASGCSVIPPQPTDEAALRRERASRDVAAAVARAQTDSEAEARDVRDQLAADWPPTYPATGRVMPKYGPSTTDQFITDGMEWALELLLRRDEMNAAVHCTVPRYSESTVRLRTALGLWYQRLDSAVGSVPVTPKGEGQ